MDNTKRVSKTKVFWNTFFSRGVIVKVAVIIIALFLFISFFAKPIGDLILHHDPLYVDLAHAFATPSKEFLLGADSLGRDILTRLVYGAQTSLKCSVFSCLVGAAAGILLGLIAGYFEGPVGMVIMRYVDVQMSIPPLIFTICIGLIVGSSLFGVVVALSFGMIPGFCRMIYGLVLQIKNNDYVMAAKVIGVKPWKVLFRHILPNTFPSMIVMFAMSMGGTIMMESTLSFLGIGIQLPTPSWGNMISEGYQYVIRNKLLLSFAPGLCLMLVIIAFNIVGDALRDSLDPKLRGKL